MQGLRDFGNALMVALLSIGLMVGALSISLVEFVPEAAPTATSILLPSPLPLTATSTFPPTSTPVPGLETATSTITPAFTNTSAAIQSSCQYPSNWVRVTIQTNDTIDNIAARYRVSKDELKRGNCLISDSLFSGTVLYVPLVPTSTMAVCRQGAAGWVKSYVVKPGDTLYAIAANHYSTSNLMKTVNCRISDIIYSGEILWVPNVATRTPYPTPMPGSTITPYPTDPLTLTALPFTATVIPSNTFVPPSPTSTPTPIPVPTQTASPTAFP